MNMTARHDHPKAKQLCQRCRDPEARFRYRTEVNPSLLCLQCYRTDRDHDHVKPPVSVRHGAVRSPLPRFLTERQIQHRLAMLAFARRAT